MIDAVFWKQVSSVWSEECIEKLADESKVLEDSCTDSLVDDLMDLSLDL